ncbi:MAG: trypsin-like peptidase domain-containing protein [Fuerstiella sp.]
MFEACRFRFFCILLVGSTSVHGAEIEIEPLQQQIYSTIQSVKPAVVSLGRRGSAFSGVIVSKEGHILSAGHAVEPGEQYRVILPDGRRLTAVGKGSNPQADCALLKITSDETDLPFVEMGESGSLVRNQPCLSISFPGGQGLQGVPVVRFGRIVRSARGSRMLQSTALMEPGDSGGPLFDLQGKVIGIHSRIGLDMSRNYDVPIDTFAAFWNELNRQKSFTQSGPPVPRLGFRGRDLRDGSGIQVNDVLDDTLAAEHGLQPNDVIQTVYGDNTAKISELKTALIAARDDGAEEIVVKVLRGEESVELKVPFDVERDSAPEVALPDYGDRKLTKPRAIAQLADLPGQFTDLESDLDDVCVGISSQLADGEQLSIVGTLIKATSLIVSKNSMVGDNPVAKLGDAELKLEVVARDSKNDLILLKSTAENVVGIEIGQQDVVAPDIGSFLITPEWNGKGLISVVSSETFTSRKQQSRGFLGVMPADHEESGGAILREVTEGGAADRAGLQVGDIVTKLNETKISTHQQLRRFLGTVDPNDTVVAMIIRAEERLKKTIRLGAYPSGSGHAADKMDKSGRRDGFSKVIPHDADLEPDDCGGPVFDLQGNFVGLNIARNSRVRSYIIPRTIVKNLVENN